MRRVTGHPAVQEEQACLSCGLSTSSISNTIVETAGQIGCVWCLYCTNRHFGLCVPEDAMKAQITKKDTLMSSLNQKKGGPSLQCGRLPQKQCQAHSHLSASNGTLPAEFIFRPKANQKLNSKPQKPQKNKVFQLGNSNESPIFGPPGLLEMISEAITSSFHKRLLRRPKPRKGLEATKGPKMTKKKSSVLFRSHLFSKHF